MDSSQGTTLESSASYTCDSGYEFAPMVSSVTCLRDGGWSDNAPNCVPIGEYGLSSAFRRTFSIPTVFNEVSFLKGRSCLV